MPWTDLNGHLQRPIYKENSKRRGAFASCTCGIWTEVGAECHKCRRKARNKWRRETIAKLRARGYK